MSFASQHARALAKVRAKGFAVTFTRETPGTHDPATGLVAAPSVSTVSGYAIRVKAKSVADQRAYERAQLTPGEAPMLFFVASTYGLVPVLGSNCEGGGIDGTVREFGDPVAPDAVVIASRPVVAIG